MHLSLPWLFVKGFLVFFSLQLKSKLSTWEALLVGHLGSKSGSVFLFCSQLQQDSSSASSVALNEQCFVIGSAEICRI